MLSIVTHAKKLRKMCRQEFHDSTAKENLASKKSNSVPVTAFLKLSYLWRKAERRMRWQSYYACLYNICVLRRTPVTCGWYFREKPLKIRCNLSNITYVTPVWWTLCNRSCVVEPGVPSCVDYVDRWEQKNLPFIYIWFFFKKMKVSHP